MPVSSRKYVKSRTCTCYRSIEMPTFKVDRVPKESSPLPHQILEQATRNRIGKVKPEAFSKTTRPTVFSGYSTHAFVSAVNLAYAQHYPLVLSPDAIWMCITQGLSQHINTNAEKLRNMFVEHEGKKEISYQASRQRG